MVKIPSESFVLPALLSCVSLPPRPVPALPEARGKQAADHAPAAEEIQEPNHLGLQDPRRGVYRHGRGTHVPVVCASALLG